MPERLLSESEVAAEFRSAIQAHGLEPPEVFKPGTFQRFPGVGKGPSNDAGWCQLFPDGKGGVFGDYSSGLSETWFVNSKSASPEQGAQAQRARKQARIKWEEETSARHTQAAREVQKRWEQGPPAPEGHHYLRLKRIKPHNLRATPNGALLVPVYDRNGQLSSAQTIFERNGEFQKRYHKGSATGGDHHSLIGGSSHYLSEDAGYTGTICIAEGLATAASIHEATGHLAVVAFQANSLEAVAELARERRPSAKIVLCADNDATTEGNGKGNPGVEAATKAAQAVGAHLAIPPALESKSVDFNDLAVTQGLDAVNDAIKEAEFQTARVEYCSSANDDEWLRKDYPLQEIPELLRNAITEVQSFTRTPVSMAASSAISTLSLAAQQRFDVERADKLRGPIALFMLTIADSGERKTTNDKMFLEPIHEFEADTEEEARGAMRIYKTKHAQWKTQEKAILSSNITPKSARFEASENRVGESSMTSNKHIMQMENDKALEDHARKEPEKPKFPHLIYQDATPESLLWELHDTWPSGGVMTSEGNLVFGSHGMSDSSIQKNLGAYNMLWDGDPVSVDRKTSESFTVRNARLTLSIQVQEEPLREFIGRGKGLARNSGFLARCLITHPESTKGSRMYRDPPEHWPALSKYQEFIKGLLDHGRPSGENPTRRILSFDKEAQKLWVEFHDTIEYELRPNGEYEAISDLASKQADNMARLATLFQIVMDGPDAVEEIGVGATQGAIAVAEWHLYEERNFLKSASMPESMRDADRILAWMDKDNLKSITKRDLQRNVTPGEIRHGNRFNAALDALEDQGDIRIEKKDKKRIVIRS